MQGQSKSMAGHLPAGAGADPPCHTYRRRQDRERVVQELMAKDAEVAERVAAVEEAEAALREQVQRTVCRGRLVLAVSYAPCLQWHVYACSLWHDLTRAPPPAASQVSTLEAGVAALEAERAALSTTQRQVDEARALTQKDAEVRPCCWGNGGRRGHSSLGRHAVGLQLQLAAAAAAAPSCECAGAHTVPCPHPPPPGPAV